MGILAGIDEAGFGPILGPLVVTGTIFRVPRALMASCLWKILGKTLARDARRSRRRIAIADSKKLFAGRKTLAPLERPALVMLGASGGQTSSWHEVLHALSPRARDSLSSHPWYAGPDFELPLASETGDIGTRVTPVRRDMDEHGVRLERVISEVVLEDEYNRLVGSTRNKSVVLLGVVLRIVDAVFRLAGDDPVRIVVDRLGGRLRYRPFLANAFPECDLRIVEESSVRSAYELRVKCGTGFQPVFSPVGNRCHTGSQCGTGFQPVIPPAESRCQRRSASPVRWIEFRTNGEDHALPTALASIYSKYMRELFMHAFNRYWSGVVLGVRPTAGYYKDGLRFLKDIGPALDRLAVDRSMLVRVK